MNAKRSLYNMEENILIMCIFLEEFLEFSFQNVHVQECLQTFARISLF
jgi:hypothetical protein